MPENVGLPGGGPSLELDLARIEGEAIVIRIPLANLAFAVAAGSDMGAIEPPLEVTDAAVFAPELVRALNREDEQGSTPIHRLLDEAVSYAANQGAEGVEIVEEEIWGEGPDIQPAPDLSPAWEDVLDRATQGDAQ